MGSQQQGKASSAASVFGHAETSRKETHVLSTKSLADESLHSLHVIIFSWGTAAIFPSLPEIYAKLQNIFKYRLPLISPFFQNFPAISAVQQAKEL